MPRKTPPADVNEDMRNFITGKGPTSFVGCPTGMIIPQEILNKDRGATEKEALQIIRENTPTYAKHVGQNVLKVFLSGERSFYTKGTVKVRAKLEEFV